MSDLLTSFRYSSERVTALTPYGFSIILRATYTVIVSDCCRMPPIELELNDPWPRCGGCNQWFKLRHWEHLVDPVDDLHLLTHTFACAGYEPLEATLLACELEAEVALVREKAFGLGI